MSLRNKSITELRGIYQSFGGTIDFSHTPEKLIQLIELKQAKMIPEPDVVPPKPEYDARLMTRPPSKKSAQDEVMELLDTHIKRGLHVSFPEPEIWRMRWEKREDTGTMRMPLRTVLTCAERLMR